VKRRARFLHYSNEWKKVVRVWRLNYIHEIPISKTLGNRGEDLGSSDRRNRMGETAPAIFGYLKARVLHFSWHSFEHPKPSVQRATLFWFAPYHPTVAREWI
jgi:hypothetical protein